MITILVIFCQLALLHVHCVPKYLKRVYQPDEAEQWSLDEAWVTVEETEHYTGRVTLYKYDSALCIEAFKDENSRHKDVQCFEMNDLYAVLDDTMYAVPSGRVIRMKLAASINDAKCFKKFFVPTRPDAADYLQTFVQVGKYGIVKVVEADESIDIKRIDSSDDETKPINLSAYAQYDEEGNDTGNRRFIIGGGVGDALELFVVFNQGDYNFIRKDATNRFVLEVRPPGDFQGKMYYGLMLDCRNDTPDKFAEEMSRYASSSIAAPKKMLPLALRL